MLIAISRLFSSAITQIDFHSRSRNVRYLRATVVSTVAESIRERVYRDHAPLFRDIKRKRTAGKATPRAALKLRDFRGYKGVSKEPLCQRVPALSRDLRDSNTTGCNATAENGMRIINLLYLRTMGRPTITQPCFDKLPSAVILRELLAIFFAMNFLPPVNIAVQVLRGQFVLR